MKALVLSFTLMFLASTAWCGNAKILLYGYVTQGNLEHVVAPKKKGIVEEYLNDVTITLYEDGKKIKTIKNRQTGFYSVILKSGKNYQLAFQRDGFICKRISVEAAEIPKKNYKEAFKMFTDIAHFPEIEGKDFTKYSKSVIAKCVYNKSKDRMAWDMNYAREVWGLFLEMSGVMKSQALLEE